MPASEPKAASFDVSAIHDLLNKAEAAFQKLFDGHHAFGHVERFTPHLDTVRMIVNHSASEASKETE